MLGFSSSIFFRVYDPLIGQSLLAQSSFRAVYRSLIDGFQRYADFVVNEFEPLYAKGRLAAEVLTIVEEANQALTFVLRPSVHWRSHIAGQYVSLDVDIDGVRYRRHYSLSSSPEEFESTGVVRITVKRVDGGRVSNYLHDQVAVGQMLYISQPEGEFIQSGSVSDSNDLLFIAAGSGITPIMAMIESLCQQDIGLSGARKTISRNKKSTVALTHDIKPFTLIYVVRTEADVIFAKQLADLEANISSFSLHIHVTERSGRLSQQQLSEICPDVVRRQVYLCGPYEFMESIQAMAAKLGFGEGQIKRELFGLPRRDLSELNEQALASGHVSFSASGTLVESNNGKSILELAEYAGLAPKYGCRAGVCHECTCQKSSGRVKNILTGKLIPDEQSQIQACISAPVGDLTISDW